jgi:AcrR family transcriptional regulator
MTAPARPAIRDDLRTTVREAISASSCARRAKPAQATISIGEAGRPLAPKISPPPGDVEPGRRARNKQEKSLRLRAAARELFVERGYDQATTREIALRAGIGMGTLFTYAHDKRDLLFLIVNDELEALAAAGFAQIDPALPAPAQITALFRGFFEFFAQQPDLARFILREQTFFESAPQARRFLAARELLLDQIARRLRHWQADATVRPAVNAENAARAIVALFAGIVRDCFAEPKPDIEAGLARLRQLIELLFAGIGEIA